MPRIVVMPPVSAALGRALSDRDSLILALNRLYDQLENNYDRFRPRRDPEDEALFEYVLQLFDGREWHTLRFSVDDCQATDLLFVVGVSYRRGKLNP